MIKTKLDYLIMQRNQYEADAATWSLWNRDPVVGSYDAHNACTDYDTLLFKEFDTNNKIAIEYGCGPGRNLVRFNKRFKRIDGTDIAQTNLDKARINLLHHGIGNYQLFLCDGESYPVADSSYDVAFSVICLQHICCHTIRYNIMKDTHRILKLGGYFCFQMGFGGRRGSQPVAEYYDNAYDARTTNSGHDVVVRNIDQLADDLHKIGFYDFKYDLRLTGPGDDHMNWIWVQVQK